MNNIFFIDESHKIYPEWEAKKLGEIVTIRTGKLDANAQVENGAFRFYTCAKTYSMIDNYAFDTEALLISGNGAHVGYIHYYKGKFNAYQRTYVVEVPKADTKFIQYYLERHLKQRIEGEKNEGSMPYIVLGTLTEMPVSLPSLAEQQKIAEFFSALDERIALTADKVKLLKEQKAGYLQRILAQEMVFTDDNGDRYPEWEQKKLRDVLNLHSGKDQKGFEDPDGQYPILATGGEIGRTNTPLCSEESVLIGRKGTIDKPKYINIPFRTVDTLFYTTMKDGISAKFIYVVVQSVKWKKLSEASGVPSLNSSIILNVGCPLPSLPEQEKIAEFFSALDEQIELTENKLTLLKEQKKGYLQGIFG